MREAYHLRICHVTVSAQCLGRARLNHETKHAFTHTYTKMPVIRTADITFTPKERRFLAAPLDPWGGSAEELAQKIVSYKRVQVVGSEVFARDPTRLNQLNATLADPLTAPEKCDLDGDRHYSFVWGWDSP